MKRTEWYWQMVERELYQRRQLLKSPKKCWRYWENELVCILHAEER